MSSGNIPLRWRPISAPMIVFGGLLVFGVSGLSTPAHAQAMNYGALENLFGEPVTTSVTGSPQRASEVPASMIIITQDEIRRSGARDIPGVLRHVPGLDVLQWTNDQADVAVRGYNQADSPRLLVLVNGRQVYNDVYGYTPWSTLPVELSDIRQIEIVKGPNSALFGFNAVSGVINIITYDPLYDDVNTASISGGTQGLVQGSAVATIKAGDNAGLRISLGGWNDDGFSTPLRPIDAGVPRGDTRKAIDILGHTQLSQNIDASLELSNSEVGQAEMTPVYTMFFDAYRTNSARATVSMDTDIGVIQATAYGNWLRETTTPPNSAGPTYHFDNSVYVAQLRDIFKVGSDHILRLSAEYRHNEMATTPLSGANVHYDVYSGGAMWNWEIQPGLSLTNAVRVDNLLLGRSGVIPAGYGLTNADWNSRSLTETSFNSGIVWQPDANDTLRLTVAHGVQIPNLLDLGGLLFPAPPYGYASGIPTLRPTTMMNYEVAWDRELSSWHATLHVSAFHQTSNGVMANSGGSQFSEGLVSTPANIGHSKATGVELSLNGTVDGTWRWGLSYTPEVISDDFRPSFNAATVLVDYEHTHPVHVVNANLGWAQGPWEIDGYLRYESQFDGIQGQSVLLPAGRLVRIPNYVSVDGRVAYRLTDYLTLALSGQNILDSPQMQTSGAEVERRVYLTASANF